VSERILQTFKRRFMARLGSGAAGSTADFSHAKFLAAAFVHASIALKVCCERLYCIASTVSIEACALVLLE
jgi:hypothetical protein